MLGSLVAAGPRGDAQAGASLAPGKGAHGLQGPRPLYAPLFTTPFPWAPSSGLGRVYAALFGRPRSVLMALPAPSADVCPKCLQCEGARKAGPRLARASIPKRDGWACRVRRVGVDEQRAWMVIWLLLAGCCLFQCADLLALPAPACSLCHPPLCNCPHRQRLALVDWLRSGCWPLAGTRVAGACARVVGRCCWSLDVCACCAAW